MKLTTYPADYSSAYDDNHFCFEEVDVATPTEIAFLDADSQTLGARRYASQATIATSPRSLLHRLLAPEPCLMDKCGCVAPEGRSAAIVVTYNDGAELSPLVHFTASHTPTLLHEVMGGERAQERTISSGECDELAFRASQGDRLSVTCAFDGDVISHIIYMGEVAAEGINLFVVNCDAILARSRTSNVTSFKLTFTLAGSLLAKLNYRVLPAVKGATRLAWLNRDGYISYHTFRTPAEERLVTSRSECRTPSGTLTLGVESWRESTLRSGYLSAAEMERLAGLVASPRVWKIAEGAFEPQILLSHTTLTGGSGAHTLELTLRPAKTMSD